MSPLHKRNDMKRGRLVKSPSFYYCSIYTVAEWKAAKKRQGFSWRLWVGREARASLLLLLLPLDSKPPEEWERERARKKKVPFSPLFHFRSSSSQKGKRRPLFPWSMNFLGERKKQKGERCATPRAAKSRVGATYYVYHILYSTLLL